MIEGNIRTQSINVQGDIVTRSAAISGNIEQGGSGYVGVETDPIFKQSPAYTITQSDINRWNAGGAVIDMSAYVTKEQLTAQSYATNSQLNNYATKQTLNSYVTKSQLANMSYVTKNQIANMSYVTKNDLSNMGYITAASLPNMSSYVTKSQLNSMGYVTASALTSYVTKSEIANMGYITSDALTEYATQSWVNMQGFVTASEVSRDYQPKGDYLTSETDPVFSTSVASNITQTDIDNWNAASGGVDMSAYVTKAQLTAQSYVKSSQLNDYATKTQLSSYVTKSDLSNMGYLTSVTFPDYSNTYQAKGNYVTPTQLNNMGYVTNATVTHPDYSNTYQAKGNYVTPTQLNNMGYVTNATVTHPDYSNTYQAKGNYLTSETDPVFSASVAAGITQNDINRWNEGCSGGGTQIMVVTKSQYEASHTDGVAYVISDAEPILPADFSSYVTKTELSACGYLTSVTFPDYSNTYQAKGNYVTPTQLNNMGYVTNATVTHPDYSNTYQAKGDYATIAYVTEQIGNIEALLANI